MSRRPLEIVVHHVRRLAETPRLKDAADRDLLRAFYDRHDHAAFAMLVQRHGPLVLALCRRWLRQMQDAEDAFQAVFLVLAQKAPTVLDRESLAGWLHQTAHKACLAARRARARRQRHEERVKVNEPADPAVQAAWREVQAVLDEEIQRLPERQRELFVLCCLEHLSCAEAGRRLGLKEGTVWSRLAEARKRLQARLTRRGVSLSAVLGTWALAPGSITAAVPLSLSAATVRLALAGPSVAVAAGAASSSVLNLVRDMTRVLFLAKIKAGLMLVVVLGMLGGAAGGMIFLQPSPAASQVALQPQAAAPRPRVDNYGDPLPAGVMQRLGTVRFRHEPGIWCVAFSPDGNLVASGSNDIRLWNRHTGQEVRRFHAFALWLAFTPDGKHIVSAPDFRPLVESIRSRDRSIRKWDVATGTEILRFIPRQGNYGMTPVALSPDAKTLAIACDAEIDLHDMATGAVRDTFKAVLPNGRCIDQLRFSPDGLHLAMVVCGFGVTLLDVKTGQSLWWNCDQHRHRSAYGSVSNQLAFSPDGKTLAVRVDGLKPARLLDTASGREVYSFEPGSGGFLFSQDGKRLFAEGIWEAATGKRSAQLEPHLGRSDRALSPDGRVLVAANGNRDRVLRFWDSLTGTALPGPIGAMGHVTDIAISPDGKRVLVHAYDPEVSVRCWDLPTGRQQFTWKGRSPYATAFAGDASTLAVAEQDRLALRDAETWRQIWSVPTGELGVAALAFTQDGKGLVGTSYKRGAVRIWDAETGQEQVTFEALPLRQLRQAAALSPDGKHLAGGGWENVIRVWDISTQKRVAVLAGQKADIWRICFSPDGRYVTAVSGRGDWKGTTSFHTRGDDSRIRIWDVATEKIVRTIEGPASGTWSVAWSPDGHFLATGGEDSKIRLWDLATGRERACLSGHGGPVTALTFTANGSRLFSGSADTTVLLWDLANLR